MGIEPTRDSVFLPHNGFEDRTPHQRRSIPIGVDADCARVLAIAPSGFKPVDIVNYHRDIAGGSSVCRPKR